MPTVDENEIKYSERYDGQDNINLQDYVPEALIKIYPYRAIYGGKNKTIIQTNTKTIVRLSQREIADFDLANMKEDEDTGDKYIEIFSVIDEDTKKTISSGTSTFIQDVRKIKTFTAITNNYIESTDDKPDFFTIGEPFNKQMVDSGEQIIYYGSSFTPSYAATKQMIIDEYDVEDESKMSEIVLQDVSQLEEQFSKSKLFFRITSLPLNNVSNIKIKTLPNIMIDKVKVKGVSTKKEGSELLDIDFKTTNENLSWFNAIPITIKDKVEITTPWFDENITLDKSIIEEISFNQGTTGWTWKEFCKIKLIPGSLENLVLDMLLYSYEFSNTFGNVPRTDTGAMVPKIQLGTQKVFVSSVANTTPKDTITGLYRKWKKLNPLLVDLPTEKIVKGFIAALSQEISSDLSVAGGENDFNKNVLPWRIVLSESLKIDEDSKNYGGENEPDDKDKYAWFNLKDFKFRVDIKEITDENGIKENVNPYFKLENHKFVNLNDIDLSESKFIESERRIILPELPETISEIDKINNIGDFSTTSSRDLKYMLKLPLTSDEINKMFEGDLPAPGPKQVKISGSDLGEKYNAYTQAEAKPLIEKQILQLYPDAKKPYTETKAGQDVEIDNREQYTIAAILTGTNGGPWIWNGASTKVNGNEAQQDHEFEKYFRTDPTYNPDIGSSSSKKLNYFSELRQKYFFVNAGLDVNATGASGFAIYKKVSNMALTESRERFRNLVQKFYHIDDINDVVIDVFTLNADHTEFTYAFHIIRHDFQGYEYEIITNLASKELISRQTIYDRPKWKQLIKSIVDDSKPILRDIVLEEKYGVGPYELREISFSSLFGDKIWIYFSSGDEIEVELNQRDDETLSTTRIVFY